MGQCAEVAAGPSEHVVLRIWRMWNQMLRMLDEGKAECRVK